MEPIYILPAGLALSLCCLACMPVTVWATLMLIMLRTEPGSMREGRPRFK